MTVADQAAELRRLHDDPALLVMVNVWDVISATTLAGLDGCRAIATASHSIAAAAGYPDGEHIPRDEMLQAAGRIAAAVDVPVSADLEAGYGDAGETIRRAVGEGIVGANLEDELKPIAESVAAVEAAIAGAPDVVAKVQSGKVQALGALVGAVMKTTRGKADAGTVKRMLEERVLSS